MKLQDSKKNWKKSLDIIDYLWYYYYWTDWETTHWCLCSRIDQLTIGRGDAPTLPPSGLWSSEEGLGRLSTHVRPCEFGDSTAGCHGERNVSQEFVRGNRPLSYLWGAWGQPSTLEGLWGRSGWRQQCTSEGLWGLSVAVLAGRGARHSESLRGLGGISEATLRLGYGGYPKMSANKIIYKCNKYPKRNFSHET